MVGRGGKIQNRVVSLQYVRTSLGADIKKSMMFGKKRASTGSPNPVPL